MRFSERKGLRKVKTEISKDKLDQEVKNGLWNVFIKTIWYDIKQGNLSGYVLDFFRRMWDELFKLTIDKIPTFGNLYSYLHKLFFIEFEWNESVDFIEFLAENYPNPHYRNIFIKNCNEIFRRELYIYRILDNGVIIELPDEEATSEINRVLEYKDSLNLVKVHIETAIKMLKEKDYRNSIKESISGVETIGRLITGKRKAELSRVLKVIEVHISIHPAFKSALEKFYAYTSDENGIRHSLMEVSDLDVEDAHFMLIACSAFINYLKEKAIKSNISLE